MKSPKKTSLLTKSPFLPLTDTIHYTFKKDFSLKVNSTGTFLLSLPYLSHFHSSPNTNQQVYIGPTFPCTDNYYSSTVFCNHFILFFCIIVLCR